MGDDRDWYELDWNSQQRIRRLSWIAGFLGGGTILAFTLDNTLCGWCLFVAALIVIRAITTETDNPPKIRYRPSVLLILARRGEKFGGAQQK